MSRHAILKPSLFILLCLLLTWGTIPVSAATHTVTDEATLRTAVTNAVAGDIIEIQAGITIQLTSILPTISANGVTINGNGATIKGGTNIRIFTIASGGNVTINSLTMQNGNCSGSCPIGVNTGGGIYNAGTVTITNSTLSGNSATSFAGGIYNAGTVTITNSTFSGNSSTSLGGSIFNSGTVTITNSTFSGNSATPLGGGVFNANVGRLTLKNTMLSKGASGTNCFSAGTLLSNGAAYNLADDASCGAGVTQVSSLGLGTLGANGGSTQTIALLVGSPAIDAGEDALCAAAPVNAVDQRGYVRPVGLHCDIGAFEYGAAPYSPPAPPSTSSVPAAPTAIPSPALCSLTGFASSTQVAMSLPNGNNGLNVCYSLITDPAQAGVTQLFALAAEVYTFDGYGSVTTGVPVQVCLQGVGTLLYRSAVGQPRVTVNLPSFSQNGFTCGLIPNAGTVILIPGAAAPAAAIPPTALSNCRVTTTNILNLRAAPDATSAILTKVPYQTTLSASARSGAWLQVVFGSQQGWLSAGYLSLDGDCG